MSVSGDVRVSGGTGSFESGGTRKIIKIDDCQGRDRGEQLR